MADSSNVVMIIKAGKKQVVKPFERAKLIASIEASCTSVSLPVGMSRDTARDVCVKVEKWLSDKSEVTSEDIRRIAAQQLTRISAEAGYFYANYKQMF